MFDIIFLFLVSIIVKMPVEHIGYVKRKKLISKIINNLRWLGNLTRWEANLFEPTKNNIPLPFFKGIKHFRIEFKQFIIIWGFSHVDDLRDSPDLRLLQFSMFYYYLNILNTSLVAKTLQFIHIKAKSTHLSTYNKTYKA